jgi:membrane protease YdiL (CAAX protease family)
MFFLPQLVLGVPILGIVIRADRNISLLEKLKLETFKPSFLLTPFILLLFFPLQGFIVLAIKQIYTYFNLSFPAPIYQQIAEHAPLSTFIAMGISALFLAPVVEELIFRRIIFSFLKHHFSQLNATIITALLFATMHGSFSLIPIYFSLAVLLQHLYISKKSLYPAIIFHFSYNAVSFASMIFIYRLKL